MPTGPAIFRDDIASHKSRRLPLAGCCCHSDHEIGLSLEDTLIGSPHGCIHRPEFCKETAAADTPANADNSEPAP